MKLNGLRQCGSFLKETAQISISATSRPSHVFGFPKNMGCTNNNGELPTARFCGLVHPSDLHDLHGIFAELVHL